MKNRFQIIQDKQQQIIALDKDFTIFGADSNYGHQYKFNPTISIAELAKFEKKFQVQLPEEYKTYLTTIANGGIGPYYGLYPFSKGMEEAIDYSTAENTPVQDPFKLDFPYSNQQTKAFIKHHFKCVKDGNDEGIEYLEVPDELTGVIFLAEYGCGGSYLLVIKGEQAGTIWFHGDFMCPCFDQKGKQWSFLDWYEDWLDTSLESFNPKPVPKEIPKDITIYSKDGWQLEELPEEVFGFKKLKKLMFSRNALKSFPKRITELLELKTLDLSMNPFVEIPAEIGELKNLTKLNLSYNRHTDLPDEFAKLKKLTDFNMFYNSAIQKMPPVLFQLPRLKNLKCSYSSELSEVGEGLGNLKNLEMLNLMDCGMLQKLPDSLSNLTKLKYLYLGQTGIKTLPKGFENLQNLEILEINCENLDLEDAFQKIKNMPKLSSLKIIYQKEMPTSFKDLIYIKRLSIGQNYALDRAGFDNVALPENICLLPNLEHLSVAGNNQIGSLPENIGNLQTLKSLDTNSTKIKKYPESIRLLKNLVNIQGGVERAHSPEFGLPASEKEKIKAMFPLAKVWIS